MNSHFFSFNKMGNCCSKCTKDPPPPTITSISGQEDLVDIEHERVRQAAIALNLGKGPVKLEGKFRIGFEKESFTKYKRHPPEERGSLESVYRYVPSIPLNNTPAPMKKEFNIPTELPRFNDRRNSK